MCVFFFFKCLVYFESLYMYLGFYTPAPGFKFNKMHLNLNSATCICFGQLFGCLQSAAGLLCHQTAAGLPGYSLQQGPCLNFGSWTAWFTLQLGPC